MTFRTIALAGALLMAFAMAQPAPAKAGVYVSIGPYGGSVYVGHRHRFYQPYYYYPRVYQYRYAPRYTYRPYYYYPKRYHYYAPKKYVRKYNRNYYYRW
jgi:hypothetical protein